MSQYKNKKEKENKQSHTFSSSFIILQPHRDSGGLLHRVACFSSSGDLVPAVALPVTTAAGFRSSSPLCAPTGCWGSPPATPCGCSSCPAPRCTCGHGSWAPRAAPSCLGDTDVEERFRCVRVLCKIPSKIRGLGFEGFTQKRLSDSPLVG